MLRRRSIRTKLIVFLGLLSTIVMLLAASGFWGLYGYQKLANAITIRAGELSAAEELVNLAARARESNDQILATARNFHNLPLDLEKKYQLDDEPKEYATAIADLHYALEVYANDGGEQSELQRAVTEEPSLVRVRQAMVALKKAEDEQGLDFRYARTSLRRPLNTLVTAAQDHKSLINADIQDLTDELSAHYRTWTSMAWIFSLLALSMVGMLLWALNSHVLKPFRTLLDGSRLVAGGQFDHRIDLGTGDELSELAVAMNDMTDRFQGALNKVNSWCTDLDRQVRERTREVIQNEQLASVGFLAAGVAHEINNPLATIAWSAESLESRVGEISQVPAGQRTMDDELTTCLTENLRRIEEEAYRCKGITEKLLDFSRLGDVQRASTNLVDLVNDVVTMVGKVGKYRCNTMRVHNSGEVVAHVNPQEIRQVVLNLVTNALESVDSDGSVDVHVETDDLTASVAVVDNGCGMDEEVLQHLFEPFFTRRRDGTGTGLGLSITYRIVSQHGGSLIAHSEGEGRGSRMEILLPVEPESEDKTRGRTTLGLAHEWKQV